MTMFHANMPVDDDNQAFMLCYHKAAMAYNAAGDGIAAHG